ncbi:MAG: hypothetical protein RIE32_02570 [Phycisphaerales bacterium]
MGAHQRAREDRERGDLGSARRRLASLVALCGFDRALCREIADISLEMGDPLEAGRWLFLCVSDSSSEPEAILAALDQFVRDCRAEPSVIASRLPAVAKSVPPERLPPAVRERLAELGLPRPRARPARGAAASARDRALHAGCLLAMAALVVCAVAGFGVIIRWFVALFTQGG